MSKADYLKRHCASREWDGTEYVCALCADRSVCVPADFWCDSRRVRQDAGMLAFEMNEPQEAKQ